MLTTLTFEPGSGSGAQTCVSVMTHVDNLVEAEENFVTRLALVTQEGSNFGLGNTDTTISLIDANGKKTCTCC